LGSQSLETSGYTLVSQTIAVTAGASYTASVDAMTTAASPLTGSESAYLVVLYFNSGGQAMGGYGSAVQILTAASAAGGPLTGSVGSQGWNQFSATSVAPAGAASAEIFLEQIGSGGGSVYWDNAQLGPTAPSSTNVLSNSSFESPASAGSTLPSNWGVSGTASLSTQYAYLGSQSLQTSGYTLVSQTIAVTAGDSYTASVDAMTTGLTGSESAYLVVVFFNSSGQAMGGYGAADQILTASSSKGGALAGSVGSLGWNQFSTTTVAPAGAASAEIFLEQIGSGGGSVYWDNAQLGLTGFTNTV
jgi:hypothetical protein